MRLTIENRFEDSPKEMTLSHVQHDRNERVPRGERDAGDHRVVSEEGKLRREGDEVRAVSAGLVALISPTQSAERRSGGCKPRRGVFIDENVRLLTRSRLSQGLRVQTYVPRS